MIIKEIIVGVIILILLIIAMEFKSFEYAVLIGMSIAILELFLIEIKLKNN